MPICLDGAPFRHLLYPAYQCIPLYTNVYQCILCYIPHTSQLLTWMPARTLPAPIACVAVVSCKCVLNTCIYMTVLKSLICRSLNAGRNHFDLDTDNSSSAYFQWSSPLSSRSWCFWRKEATSTSAPWCWLSKQRHKGPSWKVPQYFYHPIHHSFCHHCLAALYPAHTIHHYHHWIGIMMKRVKHTMEVL